MQAMDSNRAQTLEVKGLSELHDNEVMRWILRDDTDRLLIIPLLDQADPIACLVFALHDIPDSEEAVFQNLASAYAMHVAMVHRLLREREEKQHAERMLTESRELYRNLFHNLGAAVLLHDLQGHIVEVNNKMKELFGFEEDELLRMRFVELRDEADRAAVYAARRDAVLERGTLRFESTFVRKSGARFTAEVTTAALDLDDRVFIQNIIRDVTEQEQTVLALLKARDDAQAAARSRATFLANVSHELRTPLNAILGYTEAMIEECQDTGNEDFEQMLCKVQRSSNHLLSLINDLLDLTKVTAGGFTFENRPIDIVNLVRGIEEVAQTLVKKSQNELIVSVPSDIGTMRTDDLRLRQVILNLVSNAAKFTVGGTVSFIVTPFIKNEKAWVRFSVSDTGIGIETDKLDDIFRPFSQGKPSISRIYGGTGLGLAVSRELTRAMGGELFVESAVGKGSTFYAELPRSKL